MENSFGAWFHQPDLQPPDLNKLSSSFNPRQQNICSAPMGAISDAFPVGVTLPGSSGVPNFRGYGTPNPPNGWFYGLPRFRQNFNFVPNSAIKQEVPVSSSAHPKEAIASNQKRFIVFDQSGGQTTAIYSDGIRTPVPCLTSMCPNVSTVHDMNEIMLVPRRDTIQYATPVIANESHGILKEDSETEMHENTDEINALLYSTDEDENSENEEEASTGHSPCVITANDNQQLYEEIGEEVASSFRPAKRMKLADGGYNVPSLHDTASSANLVKCSDYEDDAESSCGDGKNDTRSRKEKIRETVSILQKILPLGKDKDVIVILDEAIGYLKSLKHKALDLGLEIH